MKSIVIKFIFKYLNNFFFKKLNSQGTFENFIIKLDANLKLENQRKIRFDLQKKVQDY